MRSLPAVEADLRRATGARVLPAKLEPPLGGRVPQVTRTALVNRLRASRATVVQVVAPAGYGKSTVLRDWADRDRRSFAWLTLDEHDNDVGVFLTSLTAALAHAGVNVDAHDGCRPVHEALVELAYALGSPARPVVLVLDDVQVLRSRESLSALAVLIEHVAAGSAVALASRAEPPLAAARLRLEGRLFEVRTADLRLSEKEARSLLRACGAVMSDVEADAITAAAEGWAAGVQLAARSFEEQGRDARWPSTFAGSDRFVTDYLRLEVLTDLSPAERRFLARTAVLQRLCGPLCDAVLGQSGSGRMLEKLERAGCFLTPLDHRREWYRCHGLFRGALLADLERVEPHLVPGLHAAAARWLADHGLPELAIGHAAGDERRVAQLLRVVALPAFDQGRVADVLRWFHTFDEVPGQQVADLPLQRLWIHSLAGTSDVDDHPRAVRDSGRRNHPAALVLEAAWCREGADVMEQDAGLALRRLPRSSPWHAPALLLLGVSLAAAGDERADGVLEAAAAAAESRAADGPSAVASLAHAERGALALATDDWDRGERHAQQASARAADLPGYPIASLGYAVAARVAIRRGDLAQAHRDLRTAEQLEPSLSHALPWLGAQARLEVARAHVSLADPATANRLLAELDELLSRYPQLAFLAAAVDSLRADTETLDDAARGSGQPLTGAELRLVPYLATHLSFREIARRLFVSRNTVKTQAISIYRKLGVSSRSEAVERAADLALVDASHVTTASEGPQPG